MKLSEKQKELYNEWRVLINMTAKELQKFLKDFGKVAGLSRKQASSMGIRSGRDSAKAIIRMKSKPVSKWTKNDWEWARRQLAFVKRFTFAVSEPLVRYPIHPLFDNKDKPTRYFLALKLWGYDPFKMAK